MNKNIKIEIENNNKAHNNNKKENKEKIENIEINDADNKLVSNSQSESRSDNNNKNDDVIPINNIKANVIPNQSRIYKKNSKKMFSRINNDKKQDKNLYNTSSSSNNNNNIKKGKELIPNSNHKYIKEKTNTQRNEVQIENDQFKKISNTIENIPKDE